MNGLKLIAENMPDITKVTLKSVEDIDWGKIINEIKPLIDFSGSMNVCIL